MIQRVGKTLYYCKEHKGWKSAKEHFWELILEILGESDLRSSMFQYIKPAFDKYGREKIVTFLYEDKEKYMDIFNDGSRTFKTLDNKLKYLAKIFDTELPKFQLPTETEEPVVQSFYEPEYDSSIQQGITSKFETRKTLDEKKEELIKAIENNSTNSQVPNNVPFTGLVDYITQVSKKGK